MDPSQSLDKTNHGFYFVFQLLLLLVVSLPALQAQLQLGSSRGKTNDNNLYVSQQLVAKPNNEDQLTTNQINAPSFRTSFNAKSQLANYNDKYDYVTSGDNLASSTSNSVDQAPREESLPDENVFSAELDSVFGMRTNNRTYGSSNSTTSSEELDDNLLGVETTSINPFQDEDSLTLTPSARPRLSNLIDSRQIETESIQGRNIDDRFSVKTGSNRNLPAQRPHPSSDQRIMAAVKTKHSFEYRPIEVEHNDLIEPRVIEVEAKSIPLEIHFKSTSSRVKLVQSHSPRGELNQVQKSSTQEEPQRLFHTVHKPIIQEVREIISPYRKIVQEIQPVMEEVRTVVTHESKESREQRRLQQQQRWDRLRLQQQQQQQQHSSPARPSQVVQGQTIHQTRPFPVQQQQNVQQWAIDSQRSNSTSTSSNTVVKQNRPWQAPWASQSNVPKQSKPFIPFPLEQSFRNDKQVQPTFTEQKAITTQLEQRHIDENEVESRNSDEALTSPSEGDESDMVELVDDTGISALVPVRLMQEILDHYGTDNRQVVMHVTSTNQTVNQPNSTLVSIQTEAEDDRVVQQKLIVSPSLFTTTRPIASPKARLELNRQQNLQQNQHNLVKTKNTSNQINPYSANNNNNGQDQIRQQRSTPLGHGLNSARPQRFTTNHRSNSNVPRPNFQQWNDRRQLRVSESNNVPNYRLPQHLSRPQQQQQQQQQVNHFGHRSPVSNSNVDGHGRGNQFNLGADHFAPNHINSPSAWHPHSIHHQGRPF